MSAPTPDFVLGYRAMMLDGFAREVETTKRVLAAVPEGKRDYRPDPNARTAWDLDPAHFAGGEAVGEQLRRWFETLWGLPR